MNRPPSARNVNWQLVTLLVALMLLPVSGRAHEVWIEPERYTIALGDDVVADILIGQEFHGSALSFITEKTINAGLAFSDTRRSLTSVSGDIPAITEKSIDPGLHIVWLHSSPDRIHYTKFEKFEKFLNDKGLSETLLAHQQRGLPETGFVEAFSRCSKSLMNVVDTSQAGDNDDNPTMESRGRDIVTGMPIELVAEDNPYHLPPTASLPVRVYWQDAPLANAQVTVFNKQEGGDATASKLITDEDGRVFVPLDGGGEFLIDAVRIIPWDEKPKDAWHSYWASLTFEIK